MSIPLDDIIWRPAKEALEEDDLVLHDDAFHTPICVYGSALYPLAKGEGQIQPPAPILEIKDFPIKTWLKEQEHRQHVPIGTRILLRRRFHNLVNGLVIQDTMMIRVEKLHKWDNYHVFYFNHELSPLPIQTKKRKFE